LLPSLRPPTRLANQGLELTQSVQHYGRGYGAENSVPLVALKPMVPRAYTYVQPGLLAVDGLSGQRITGELVLTQGSAHISVPKWRSAA
jgi:hypothetical protein